MPGGIACHGHPRCRELPRLCPPTPAPGSLHLGFRSTSRHGNVLPLRKDTGFCLLSPSSSRGLPAPGKRLSFFWVNCPAGPLGHRTPTRFTLAGDVEPVSETAASSDGPSGGTLLPPHGVPRGSLWFFAVWGVRSGLWSPCVVCGLPLPGLLTRLEICSRVTGVPFV